MRIKCEQLETANVKMEWRDKNGSNPVSLSDGCLDVFFTGKLHEDVEETLNDLQNAIVANTSVRGFEAAQMMHRLQDEITLASMLNALKTLAREGE